MKVDRRDKIGDTLNWQLIISTILLTPVIILFSIYLLPDKFNFNNGTGPDAVVIFTASNVGIMCCALSGLYAGLIIGFFTDYFTSNTHQPVQDLARACEMGVAHNVLQGIGLGYISCIIPIMALSVTILLSYHYGGMYGIAIAAIGMLSNLSICLAIDGYGPISDNAGGLAEMARYPKEVRSITDELDAAGNTTAAVGKGFAIGSACLVALALFGAFATRAQMNNLNMLEPLFLTCIIIGAAMPYIFSALTMKSVGKAAQEMCNEVSAQVREHRQNNTPLNPNRCIAISAQSSLREMILPGIIVILSPLVIGMLFGPIAVSGYLLGVIVSGVIMAISSANTGGAWDNAKKYIEGKKLQIQPTKEEQANIDAGLEQPRYYAKHSLPHSAAVIGDTIGDPLKDTSGPSLNILVKLSAITTLIFGSVIANNYLIKL
jgi:inorganic pyrophosphatase